MAENGEDATLIADQSENIVTEVILPFGKQKLKSSFQKSPSNFLCANSRMTSEKIEGKLDEALEKLESIKIQCGDVLEELQSMQIQIEKLNTQKIPVENPNTQITGKIDGKQQKTLNHLRSKQFVLKFVFEDVSSWTDGQKGKFVFQEYFGATWSIETRRNGENLGCFLHCNGPKSEWSIEVESEIKTIGPENKVHASKGSANFTGEYGFGWNCFLKWDDMQNNYLDNGNLKVEIKVEIKKTSGLYKANQRKFDESTRDVSDIVLMVDNEKFFVCKNYMAAQSSYFKAMLMGVFQESQQSEIRLKDVDASDFQKFLEVLYGELAIEGDKLLPNHNKSCFTENNIEAILLIADGYITPTVVKGCEQFLMEKSTKTLRKKLQLAVKYRLETLQKKCLTEIETVDDICSAIPVDVEGSDPSLKDLLLRKLQSFK
ncbi:unnamed protein product [Caenorhabditis brenneri]